MDSVGASDCLDWNLDSVGASDCLDWDLDSVGACQSLHVRCFRILWEHLDIRLLIYGLIMKIVQTVSWMDCMFS
jgi:hypothetical protein